MTATIPLIDSLDGFEIVRNKVATILAAEQTLQVAAATAAGKTNPSLWKLRVYLERSDPWEMFKRTVTDFSPVVNVWYDNSNTDLGASNLRSRQQMTSQINIDIVGYAEAQENDTGHLPADRESALTAQRGARLVRGIIMHGKYNYLDLDGIVGRRYVLTRTSFQPSNSDGPIQRAVGVRLTLAVDHIETIGIQDYDAIEQIYVTHKYDPDGMIIAEQDIDTTV